AWRLLLIPAARSVSSGLTVSSSPNSREAASASTTSRSNVRAESFTAVLSQSRNLDLRGVEEVFNLKLRLGTIGSSRFGHCLPPVGWKSISRIGTSVQDSWRKSSRTLGRAPAVAHYLTRVVALGLRPSACRVKRF